VSDPHPPRVVRVAAAVLDALDRHARDDSPRECCGLLIGSGDVVSRAVPARNDAPGTTRYLINPADHFSALRAARRDGLSVVGAYHSHPASAPVPSPTDLTEGLPDFLYLIVSPRQQTPGSDIRAYWLGGDVVAGVAGNSVDRGNYLEAALVPVS